MYRWYQQAEICYAYLSDIESAERNSPFWEATNFKNSKWFTRGWTLQELIAPRSVEFYASNWDELGTKSSRRDEISKITGIDVRILDGDDPAICNVAERLSWAASRKTKRIEDAAYCLLGLFQVHMPLLYGEGENALIRLQEEILKTTEDYTLLARRAESTVYGFTNPNALAGDLSAYKKPRTYNWAYSDLVLAPHTWTDAALRRNSMPINGLEVAADVTPTLTAKGLHICLPLLKNAGDGYHAYLYCRHKVTTDLLCISLRRAPGEAPETNRFERDFSKTGLFTHILPATPLESFTLTRIFIQQKREAPTPFLSWPATAVILEASATMGFVHSQNCTVYTSWGSSTKSLPWKTKRPGVIQHLSLHARVLFHFPDLESRGDFMIAFGRKGGKLWCCILLRDESSLKVASHKILHPWDDWKSYDRFVPNMRVDRATKSAPVGVVNVSFRKIASGLVVKVHIDDRSTIAELPSGL